MNIAFITGVTGQDGSYLAEFLLEKNYVVYGLVRRSSTFNNFENIRHIHDKNFYLVFGDVTDGSCINRCFMDIKNKYDNIDRFEVYNMAAQSDVKISFDVPEYTAETDGIGTLKILEAIKNNDMIKYTRFYQASTSELFGDSKEIPQNENTPLCPVSPYAVAKLYSYWIVRNYRNAYGMFACNGILFNHESPRRGPNFVTRKVTKGLANIISRKETCLMMGNVYSMRDWGHSKDFIRGMWQILQHDVPDDFVLATGVSKSVKEFIEEAFSLRGFDIKWKGQGINEIGYDANSGRELIFVDPKYYRPCEVNKLLGDATKARNVLNWYPTITFKELVKEMVDNDCK